MEVFSKDKDYITGSKCQERRNFKAYLRTLSQVDLCATLAEVAKTSPHKMEIWEGVLGAVITLTYGKDKDEDE